MIFNLIDFQPFYPTYSPDIRRRIFLSEFVKILNKETNKFDDEDSYNFKSYLHQIYKWHRYNLTSHSYKVIGSFIYFLGSNGGRDFFYFVNLFSQSIKNKERCYYLAYCLLDEREVGINGYNNLTECLLNNPNFRMSSNSYTKNDLETLHVIAKWLGTPKGQEYLHQVFTILKEN